jgi:hypothetical protein
MNGSTTSVDLLLNNVFNLGDVDNYKRGSYTGSYLVNMLYYNTSKLALKSQSYILTSPRITDVYNLYYKSDDLENSDTTFITCIVTHLKAGNTSGDASDRAIAAQQIMSYMNNRGLNGNILFMGDFNVYTSSETAFQRFMTPTAAGMQLFDPVNALGDWQNNIQFSSYHSQSTHTYGDCHSGGGMDDRFDFILASESVMEGTRGLKYIEDSYWAYGQDGNRLNQSLISPSNTTLPSSVLSALYNMSDHLPVVLKLEIDSDLYTGTVNQDFNSQKIKVINPVSSSLIMWSEGNKTETVNLQIINLQGSVVLEKQITLSPREKISIPTNLDPGIYLLRTKGTNQRFVTRIVKD